MTPQVRGWSAHLRDVVRLMRLENNGPFIQLVIGYALGGGRDLGYLAAVLFILGPCLYSGLYALNDVHDYRADRLHPKKCERPVAAGRLSPRTAYAIGVGFIFLGLAAALLLDWRVGALALLFVAFNLLYTWRLKAIPFVEIAANAITHPLRFAGGLWLAGGAGYGPVVVAGFLAVLAIATLKRFREKREAVSAVRPVLRRYTFEQLTSLMTVSLMGVVVVMYWTTGWDRALAGVWLAFAALTVVGYLRVPVLRRLGDRVWR